jgi:hypothetical protein
MRKLPVFTGYDDPSHESFMNTPGPDGISPRDKLKFNIEAVTEHLRDSKPVDIRSFKEANPRVFGESPDTLNTQQERAEFLRKYTEFNIEAVQSKLPRPRSSGGGAGGPSAAQ